TVSVIGIAFDGRGWNRVLLYALDHALQDRRHDEIRIGVGSRDAMLHATVLLAGDRDADRDRAVVLGPDGPGRRIGPGRDAPEAVPGIDEKKQGLRHRRQQAGYSRFQLPPTLRAGEDVPALLVQHGSVDVHSVAGIFDKGL